MKYRIFLFFIVFLAGFFSFSSGFLTADNKTEGKVLQAAQEGLSEFLESIPAHELTYYGFQSLEELSQAELGVPFRVYTILPDELEKYRFPDSLGDILRETPIWFVPVLVEGERRVILTVTPAGEKWETVGLSGARLASELEDFYSHISEEMESAGVSGVSSLKFVRVFQAASDFIFLQTEIDEYLKPFSSASLALGLEKQGLLLPVEIIPKLKVKVRENLR